MVAAESVLTSCREFFITLSLALALLAPLFVSGNLAADDTEPTQVEEIDTCVRIILNSPRATSLSKTFAKSEAEEKCKNTSQRRFILDEAFRNCPDIVRKANISEADVSRVCKDPLIIKVVKSLRFPECFAAVLTVQPDAVEAGVACSTKPALKISTDPQFRVCLKMLKTANVPVESIAYNCIDPQMLLATKDPQFTACIDIHKKAETKTAKPNTTADSSGEVASCMDDFVRRSSAKVGFQACLERKLKENVDLGVIDAAAKCSKQMANDSEQPSNPSPGPSVKPALSD
jgi:hypothetical protein